VGVTWGLWGTGRLAHQVADDFARTRNAILKAVGSRSGARARDFAREHGIERHAAGLDALLHDTALDAIYVASPNAQHVADCLSVIASGKAVVCEKPFALDAEGASRIADAARLRGVFCMEAMWTRFMPSVVEAKARVDRGDLGAVRLLQGNFAYGVTSKNAPALFDPASGGGALLDRGVYLISLAQHFLGAPEQVDAVAQFHASGVDEQSTYELRFAGGAVGAFSASLCVCGSNEFHVFGELGRLCLHDPFYRAHRLSYRPSKAASDEPDSMRSRSSWKAPLRASAVAQAARATLHPLIEHLAGRRTVSMSFPGHGYQFELDEASRCIAAGLIESPVMPLADSIAVMQTIDDLRRSFEAKRGRCR
jgi:predicted dehydrogenase